eukprot:CAMPEP_0114316020 /NCGR_PEP_ID=MMETSP0059-20121206/22946_1 /TAXON_ID=36894 /ORGANISM="Pyramimonas parkeae, Strain CCMP726" /LENGTH=54 /DNA_ID=CAMNT_0001441855 /DNA_START=23 /DNA_END=184 /DNA_ORIENTATION=+
MSAAAGRSRVEAENFLNVASESDADSLNSRSQSNAAGKSETGQSVQCDGWLEWR